MAIYERTIKRKGKKPEWEVRATGKDVHELRGLMKEAALQTNERSEAANRETGLIEMESVAGKRNVVREDRARALERKGFKPVKKSFVVPELPWMKGK